MKFKHLSYRSIVLICALITAVSGVFGQLTTNRDGKLDKQFGTNGLSVFDPATANGNYRGGGDLVQMPDGKILAVYPLLLTFPNGNFVLSRLLENGQPDVSFGINGRMVFSNWPSFVPIRLLVQPDGKIVLAGVDTQGVDFMVLRLTEEGKPDPTFGSNGLFRKDFSLPGGFSNDTIYSIAFQNDGKIIAAGISDRFTSPEMTTTLVSVVRLNSNGTIDESFGKNGVSTVVGLGTFTGYALRMVLEAAVTSDGKIVVATKQKRLPQTPTGYRHFINILRFRTDGTLDPEFSEDGIVDYDDGDVTPVTGLCVSANGKILVSSIVTLKRFNADGSPDETFSFNNLFNGFIQTLYITVAPNGKILSGGLKLGTGSGSGVVRRYYDDGTPDIKFGNYGESLLRNDNADTVPTRVALTSDGKLLLFGEIQGTTKVSAFIARYFITRKS